MVNANDLFQHVAEWQIIVCKECRHAVWPDHVRGHSVGTQHRMSSKEASAIGDEVAAWPGLATTRSDFTVPDTVPKPIVEIPLYSDGLKCIRDPRRCSYVCRGRKAIQNHWRTCHGWMVQNGRGGSGKARKTAAETRFRTGAKEVECQRMFVQGPHSQYFEVSRTASVPDNQARPHTKFGAMRRIWERANAHAEASERRKRDAIRPGDTTETTPWVRRTGWDRYLEGCDRSDLIKAIAPPDEEEEPTRQPGNDGQEGEDGQERWWRQEDQVVWRTMGELAAISQATVAQSGVMVRMEAVRSEVDRQRFTPLRPYQEAASIARRCQPWQQMLMFFVRTQRPHDWRSPVYRFNRRQKAAYGAMMEAVAREIRDAQDQGNDDGEDSSSRSDDGSSSRSNDGSSSRSNDDRNVDESADKEAETVAHPELRAVHRACLTFCVELMNQTIHNREYDMAMVCAAAVLGVHPQQGFRDPETYPPIISSIIKVARFMIIQVAEEMARPEEDDEQYSPCHSAMDFEGDADSGYDSEGSSPGRGSPRRRRSKPTTSFGWVQQMVRTFMARGSASPMQWLLDLRTYGLKIHYNTTAIGHVNWKDKHTLEYKDVAFTMDGFRGMVHQLVEDSRRALFEDVLFVPSREDVPSIPWEALHDNPSNRELGWSWIQDQRSRLPTDGREWLYERVQSREDLQDRFVSGESEGGYHRERVRDWMRQVARFRGLLLVLMHITGGQPARGTEILSCRHRNTAAGSHRNVFIEDGQVVFVTKYHKGIEITGDVKIIHRYLPREVGELVVWYLWLALPFIERIQALVWQEDVVSDYMWPADAEGRKWTTDRMKRELQQVSQKTLGQSISVAAYREIAIAISRQWVRGDSAFQRDSEDESIEAQVERMDGDAADEQATHSPHIAGLIYARDVMELVGSSVDRRRRFRKVSEDWHRFLGFESTAVQDDKQGVSKRKWCGFEEEAEQEQVRRRARLRRMDAQAELSWMMRKEVTLRSVQGEAMQAIQRGDGQIVAVMPTGAGKSVLFMLPAFVEPRGVSIVVVPLKGIRSDMSHRCEQLGIRWAVWDGFRPVDGASIVLVTPEKAASPEFGSFIRRLKRTQVLDRIVIDECHVILNDQLEFRKHLQELGRLAIAETQMVLLTATLPPSTEATLFERMYWRREEVTLIRGSTVRPNIAYSVIDGADSVEGRHAQLAQIVTEVLADPSHAEGKIAVMCESVRGVKRISEAGLFPCEPYYAEMSDGAREEVLDEFRRGNTRVVVATGAFGMGIDIPDIRLVVFMDEPRSMLGYGQTSGRGGRDGLPSRAIVIRGGLGFHDPLVEQYIQGEPAECRRIAIDRYLDGDEGRLQCSGEEQRCDFCEQAVAVDGGGGSQDVEMDWTTRNGEAERTTRNGEAGRTTRQGESERTTRPKNSTQAIRPSESEHEFSTPSVPPSFQVAAALGNANPVSEPSFQLQTPDSSNSGWQGRWREYGSSSRDGGTSDPPSSSAVGSEIDRETIRQMQAQDRSRQAPRIRRAVQAQRSAVSIAQIVQRLEEWKGRCVVCFRDGKSDRHIVSKCSSTVGRAAEQERRVASSKQGIPFARVVCFRCGMPRTICERWVDGSFTESGRQCQFYGVLIGVVFGIKHAYPAIWQQWWEKGRWRGVGVESIGQQMQQLGVAAQRQAGGGIWLMHAFWEMTEEVGLAEGGEIGDAVERSSYAGD